MTITVRPESASALADYARVPIAFEARAVMRVGRPAGEGAPFVLTEQPLPAPLHKDYDALPLEGPASWPGRFDLSRWTFFGAYRDGARVGGAALVARAPDVELLEGRDDLALLWDLRVAPSARRSGVGGALLAAVERHAVGVGARTLVVETQDVNVPACRFYAGHGFELRAVNPHAYPTLPGETQLLWYRELADRPARPG